MSNEGITYSLNKDDKEIFTTHQLGVYEVEIRAQIPNDFPVSLPHFHLVDRLKYGDLAHVAWGPDGYADICFGEKESFSADFHSPGIVFISSLKKVLAILDKSLNDASYNETELMREFSGVWRFHTNCKKSLICIVEPTNDITELVIRSDVKNVRSGIDAKTYAIADTEHHRNSKHYLLKNSKSSKRINKGKGLLIPIDPLLPPPSPTESIDDWWRKQITSLSENKQRKLANFSRLNKAREFFIVCNSTIGSDAVWFGIYCASNQKINLPLTPDSMTNWVLEAIETDVVSKDMLIPRGGGEIQLNERNVCLVGCGSLGGYISDMLASSGIGQLTLIDNDIYKIENIHRHKLDPNFLFYFKSEGLKFDLEYKYPFLKIISNKKKLLDITEIDFWKKFDVIIVAIGSPTHERKFNEFIRFTGIKTPVIYTWNEPFGIGGHALATFSDKKGCLACAYIDNDTDEPGLYPNVNFIKRDQNIMTSIGGCGTEFIAFSSIDSMQTAAIAAKLAIRCLLGEIVHGVSVSWKGDSLMAEQTGITLTHRYWRFNNVLKYVPLGRESCNVCYG